MKTLVAGWFSFEDMGASAGDMLALDLVREWLRRARQEYDVAFAAPFRGGVDWSRADPEAYSRLVFVCGPFGNGWPVTNLLARFSGKELIGVNLSMLEDLSSWNPFRYLWERDSSKCSRPDLVFLSERRPVPVVGLVQIDSQPEYGVRDGHIDVDQSILRLRQARRMAPVSIDTRLDTNKTNLRGPEEVEALVSRMDMVITTRLHGLVLAVKNGVPALAIDSVMGGAKVKTQADALGWPVIFIAGEFTDADLERAFDYCLTAEARSKAAECRERARRVLEQVREEFLSAVAGSPGS